jgi:hypothetical protein
MVLGIFPHGAQKVLGGLVATVSRKHLTTRSLSCPSLPKVRDPIDIGLNHT